MRPTTAPRHPAKWTTTVLERVQRLLDEDPHLWRTPPPRVLDPFAGVGGIHNLRGYRTAGMELEPEWASASPSTIVADAVKLPFADATFDALVSSPCYGNRMADHHEAR